MKTFPYVYKFVLIKIFANKRGATHAELKVKIHKKNTINKGLTVHLSATACEDQMPRFMLDSKRYTHTYWMGGKIRAGGLDHHVHSKFSKLHPIHR